MKQADMQCENFNFKSWNIISFIVPPNTFEHNNYYKHTQKDSQKNNSSD